MQEALRDLDAIRKATASIAASPLSVVLQSDSVLILNVAAYPKTDSPPHNHTMWAVIGVYDGQEDNSFFDRSATLIVVKTRRSVGAGEAIVLGPDVVHKVSNPLDTPSLALHVYGGDLLAARRSMWHPTTFTEQPYEFGRFFEWSSEMTRAFRRSAAAPT
jgi:predicted metal-dependent enzyme (double-stranded beta helix superfamily)